MSLSVTFADIEKAIASYAPFSLQESYDNSGLLIGEGSTHVRGVLVCLDVTEQVLHEAVEKGANLVVSHHPLIFRGVKQLCGNTGVERAVMYALRSGVGILAAHTNLDAAVGGVSCALAAQLGIVVERVLHPSSEDQRVGLGVVGRFAAPLAEESFLQDVCERLGLSVLRHSPLLHRLIGKVALCGGSGMEFFDDAVAAGVDAYITADVKYHDFQRPDGRLLLLDVGHRESEWCAVDLLKRILCERFSTFACHVSSQDTSPVGYFLPKNVR